jgi:thioredoxin reductase
MNDIDNSPDERAYDVVVIGGGAAGLSAALVLTRARRRVAIVDTGEPRNAPAAHMHGYLGSDGLPPADLLKAGRQEVTGYGGILVDGAATSVAPRSEREAAAPYFSVALADGSVLQARRVLVTTGLRDEIPDIAGLRERWARDVLHCPYCHGHEVRDEPLGVIGGSDEAVMHAQLIRQWSADVVYFANGSAPSASQREELAARGIVIVDDEVAGLHVVDDQLEGVRLTSGELVPRAAVFVRPRFVANDGLLTGLGCATAESGWVAVDVTGATSVPGVWAAGNAVNPRAQVITAAGEGSAAAVAINNDLVLEDVRLAVRQTG